MRALKLALLAVPVSVIVLPVIALSLAVEATPRIRSPSTLMPADIARAKYLIRAHDPRRAGQDGARILMLNRKDVELLLGYAATRLDRNFAARVDLLPRAAFVQATLELPAGPFGRYFNIEAVLRETGTLPEIDRFTLGRLPIPPAAANWALARLTPGNGGADVARDLVNKISFVTGGVRIEYETRPDLPDRLRAALISDEERERLRVHHLRLSEVLAGIPAQGDSLTALLAPMMALAKQREGDAAAENRAALITLAAYVGGRRLTTLIPEAASWPKLARRSLTLAGRGDFAQHFAISAAFAATGGGPLSDAVGLAKEFEDARHGSGFSFSDLAADRAGTLFGERATGNPSEARRFAARVAAGIRESDILPSLDDLPEFLSGAEFAARYGGPGQPAYERLIGRIEQRVAACPLYR
jgi:uncharacterized protein YfiM (DUF2279 family)